MNFGTLIKILQTIEQLKNGDDQALEDHVNSFGVDSCKQLMKNLIADHDPVQYLTKTVVFDDDVKRKVIMPVNVVRYELLSRRIAGISISLKKDVEKIKQSILKKDALECTSLPSEAIALIKEYGGGAKKDPFKSWTDNRKLATPFIINTDESRRADEELQLIGEYIIKKLKLSNASVNTANPIGSQNNSMDNYGWVAISINSTMKKSIHIGVRIHADYILAKLHVGETLIEAFIEEKIEFPFKLIEKGGFFISEFVNLNEAVEYLETLKDKWYSLNKYVDDLNLKGLESFKLPQVDIGRQGIIRFKQNLTTDSERLQNRNSGKRAFEESNQNIEIKSLYLIRIHYIGYKNKEGNLYKIGVTDHPEIRYKQIASGFGLQDLVGIEPLMCLENSGAFEKQIKEKLIDNSEIHYSGEFFLSHLEEEEVMTLIRSYIAP